MDGITTQGRGPNPILPVWVLGHVPGGRSCHEYLDFFSRVLSINGTTVQLQPSTSNTGSNSTDVCFQKAQRGHISGRVSRHLAPMLPVSPGAFRQAGGTCHGARQAILQARTSAPPHPYGTWEHVSSGSLPRRTGPLQPQNDGLSRLGIEALRERGMMQAFIYWSTEYMQA